VTSEVRILFLFLLVISSALIFIRTRGVLLGSIEPGQVLLDFFLVPAVIGTAATFFFIIFRVDPMPLVRDGAYRMSFRQLVSYDDAIPQDLRDNLAVANVERVDTDGDNADEWVVYYKFNVRDSTGPLQVVIYDNDRGNPPVIFPYVLRAPGRDYLSEGGASLEMESVTTDQNGQDGKDLQEILVHGDRELAIFRFQQNSEAWDFPRDAPPRYQPIGFFRGSGGVQFDAETKNVTVIDRGKYSRSQLIVRSIYRLNETTNTYWGQQYGPSDLDRTLAAPIFSTVDFLGGPPQDIYSAAFPEIIVMAFYASTCVADNYTLCNGEALNWDTERFLTADARLEFQNDNPGYFGLTGFEDTRDLTITDIFYYPSLETDSDLDTAGGGRDIVTGEQPQQNLVEINFAVNNIPAPESYYFEMASLDGQWKIVRRASVQNLPPLGAPASINTSAQ